MWPWGKGLLRGSRPFLLIKRSFLRGGAAQRWKRGLEDGQQGWTQAQWMLGGDSAPTGVTFGILSRPEMLSLPSYFTSSSGCDTDIISVCDIHSRNFFFCFQRTAVDKQKRRMFMQPSHMGNDIRTALEPQMAKSRLQRFCLGSPTARVPIQVHPQMRSADICSLLPAPRKYLVMCY